MGRIVWPTWWPWRRPKPSAAGAEEIKSWIGLQVATGFPSEQEIVETAVEMYSDEYDEVRPEAERLTRLAIEDHLATQVSWPETTDCDRLDAAFSELEASGIVARQNAVCCQTCALYELEQEIVPLLEAGHNLRGYTFYHEQDTEAAVDGYGICLAYGSLEEDGDSVAIGHEVAEVLRRHSFAVDWDGDIKHRIEVALDWKRRR